MPRPKAGGESLSIFGRLEAGVLRTYTTGRNLTAAPISSVLTAPANKVDVCCEFGA